MRSSELPAGGSYEDVLRIQTQDAGRSIAEGAVRDLLYGAWVE